MQPVACTGCPKGPWRQLFLVGIHDWPAVSQSRLQTGMRGAFGKPQGTVARVHIGQVIMSIRTKLQNKEHVIEALRRAKFKFPGRQKVRSLVSLQPWSPLSLLLASGPMTQLFLSLSRSTSLRSGDLPNSTRMNLRTWWQKSDSSQMAVGSNTSLIMVPWTNGGCCTHESIGAVPSLIMLTNKSYFLSKNIATSKLLLLLNTVRRPFTL